jgi:hypothetical protein
VAFLHFLAIAPALNLLHSVPPDPAQHAQKKERILDVEVAHKILPFEYFGAVDSMACSAKRVIYWMCSNVTTFVNAKIPYGGEVMTRPIGRLDDIRG